MWKSPFIIWMAWRENGGTDDALKSSSSQKTKVRLEALAPDLGLRKMPKRSGGGAKTFVLFRSIFPTTWGISKADVWDAGDKLGWETPKYANHKIKRGKITVVISLHVPDLAHCVRCKQHLGLGQIPSSWIAFCT